MRPLSYIARQILAVNLGTADTFDKMSLVASKMSIGFTINWGQFKGLRQSVDNCPPYILAGIIAGANHKFDNGLLFAVDPTTKRRLNPVVINWLDNNCVLPSGKIVINPRIQTSAPVRTRFDLLAQFVKGNPDEFPVVGDTVTPRHSQKGLWSAIIESNIVPPIEARKMCGGFEAWKRAMHREGDLQWKTLTKAAGASKVRWKRGFIENQKKSTKLDS